MKTMAKMTIKTKHLILIVLSLFLGFFILGRYISSEKIKNLENSLKMASDSISVMKVTINGKDNLLAQKEAVIMTQREAIKGGVLEKELLEKSNIGLVKTNTKLIAEINVLKNAEFTPDTIFVTIEDTVSGVNDEYVKLPFGIKSHDEWMDLMVEVKRPQPNIRFKIGCSLITTIGYEKHGIFEKPKMKSVVTTDCPYIEFKDIQTVYIKDGKRFYESNAFKILSYGAIFYLGTRMAH